VMANNYLLSSKFNYGFSWIIQQWLNFDYTLTITENMICEYYKMEDLFMYESHIKIEVKINLI
jgi:hypothetical protein